MGSRFNGLLPDWISHRRAQTCRAVGPAKAEGHEDKSFEQEAREAAEAKIKKRSLVKPRSGGNSIALEMQGRCAFLDRDLHLVIDN
jgi:hypothetical protein